MNHDKIKDVLIEARALLATPGSWTQFVSERDAAGYEVSDSGRHGPVASRCVTGAIFAAEPNAGLLHCSNAEGAIGQLRNAIKRHTECAYENMPAWNDSPERTHQEVLQALDWAINDDDQEEVTA